MRPGLTSIDDLTDLLFGTKENKLDSKRVVVLDGKEFKLNAVILANMREISCARELTKVIRKYQQKCLA